MEMFPQQHTFTFIWSASVLKYWSTGELSSSMVLAFTLLLLAHNQLIQGGALDIKEQVYAHFLSHACFPCQWSNMHKNYKVLLFSFVATCCKNLVITWHQSPGNVVFVIESCSWLQWQCGETNWNVMFNHTHIAIFYFLSRSTDKVKQISNKHIYKWQFHKCFLQVFFWGHSFVHTAKALWSKNLHGEQS